jgi:RNA polymerase sigma-70 factor (ECF subfamily)
MHEKHADSSETRRLVERVQTGDDRSFDELFDRHRSYIRQVVSLRMPRALRSRLDPSDLVQETQLEALRRARDYLKEPSLPFRLWLRRIAYDRLLMARRQHIGAARRSVEREIPLPDRSSIALANRLLAGEVSPSVQAGSREMARRVRAAVARLPETDREILLLHNFEGLTSKESAQVLGIEPATARKRYGRALRRLRRILVEAEPGGSES